MANVQKAAADFIAAIQPNIEDGDVFTVIEREARKVGYTIAAEQRGIQGTFIHFVPVE